jgi:hypothetical protein
MKVYYYHSRVDINKEPLSKTMAVSRYNAAKYFAERKQLSLKSFLLIYQVPKKNCVYEDSRNLNK